MYAIVAGSGLLFRGRDQASVQLSSSLLPRMCCAAWSIARAKEWLARVLALHGTRYNGVSTSGILLQVDSFVTRAFVALCSLHLYCRGSENSAPCVFRLSPAPIAVALGTVTATALSTSSTAVVLSASDLSPRRRTLHSHPLMSTPDVTSNTTSNHHLTKPRSHTVTRSCHSSHEAWQQQ